MKLPAGFSFSGVHAGIKPQRKDLALVSSEVPCDAAGCFTANLAKAAPVIDAQGRLPAAGVRAIVVNSGNANALTGAEGLEAVRSVHAAVAGALSVPEDAVLSASTGVIGVRLPVETIRAAIPSLVEARGADPLPAAEAILTTDTKVKTASRTIRLGGEEVTLFAICKGSGMIAPQLATMISVITTDCAIDAPLLDRALREAMEESFNALTVDGDMSTNDAVFAMASGLAGNDRIVAECPDFEAFRGALGDLSRDLAKQIARDGEGATKMVQVEVLGAPDKTIAADLAKSIAGSSLVKAALFGCDPNWGRILATVGARAGSQGYDLDPAAAEVEIQEVAVYRRGLLPFDEEGLRARMREPEVEVRVDLRQGEAGAVAWGCDLSYDYVKINADYSSLIVQTPSGGVAKDDRLTRYSPGFKVSLLLQALSYIRSFAGARCVIHLGGAAISKGPELSTVANDLLLLRSVGLLPIVVHGGESARHWAKKALTGSVNRELVALLNQEGGDAVGVSGHDGALFRIRSLSKASGSDVPAEDVEVNRAFLEMLVGRNYLPVIAPIGIADSGGSRDLDGDRVASEVAVSLGARKLVFLTDVPGILVDDRLVSELDERELRELLEGGHLEAGMGQKARAILRALAGGVEQVHVIDGRMHHGIISELFTDHGVGTLVTKG